MEYSSLNYILISTKVLVTNLIDVMIIYLVKNLYKFENTFFKI